VIGTRQDARGYPVWSAYRVKTLNLERSLVTEIPHQMVRYVRIDLAVSLSLVY